MIIHHRRSVRVVLTTLICAAIVAGCGSEVTGDVAAGPAESAGSSPAVTVPVPTVLESLPTIELTEPGGTNVGPTPRFTWLPVSAAVEYRLVVTADAGPLWAWQGPDTTVRYGGIDEPHPSSGGIRLTEPAWWSVVALDGAGNVVAVSPRRSVSPDDRLPGGGGAVTGRPADEPEGPAAPVDPTTVDPCTLFSPEEIEAALGAPVHPGELTSGGGGNYRNCTWVSTLDELDEVSITIDNRAETYNPSGWTRGEIVPVEGLGEESYLTTDFGVRIGFVRSGVVATVVALVGRDTAPTWAELARVVDQRLQGG